MPHRFVFGLVGHRCSSSARTVWNALLRERAIDGFFDFYKAVKKEDLELRLSEMFLLDRRGYIIDSRLQKAIIPMLDELDSSGEEGRGVDTVFNRGGVLIGYALGLKVDEGIEERLKIWGV